MVWKIVVYELSIVYGPKWPWTYTPVSLLISTQFLNQSSWWNTSSMLVYKFPSFFTSVTTPKHGLGKFKVGHEDVNYHGPNVYENLIDNFADCKPALCIKLVSCGASFGEKYPLIYLYLSEAQNYPKLHVIVCPHGLNNEGSIVLSRL